MNRRSLLKLLASAPLLTVFKRPVPRLRGQSVTHVWVDEAAGLEILTSEFCQPGKIYFVSTPFHMPVVHLPPRDALRRKMNDYFQARWEGRA